MYEILARRRLAAGFAAAALAVSFAGQADARSWSVTGRAGGTWNRSVSHYNNGGGLNGGGNVGRTVTTTRPNGQTATKAFDRSVSGGTITDSRTVTGFNGGTASGTFTRTPGVGGTATYTGPDGRTVVTETYTHGAAWWGPGPCCWGTGAAAAVAVGTAVGVAAAAAHPAYVAPPAVVVTPPPVVYAPAWYPRAYYLP